MLFCFGFRISPQRNKVLPNPEDPEGEDEAVQLERMRAANAVTLPDADEVGITKNIRQIVVSVM